MWRDGDAVGDDHQPVLWPVVLLQFVRDVRDVDVKDTLSIVGRGFLQVAPVATNTVLIARGHFVQAASVSFLISAIWWVNAGRASQRAGWPWACAYGSGAMLGTLAGMLVARWMAPT